jgi:hypothetical protein
MKYKIGIIKANIITNGSPQGFPTNGIGLGEGGLVGCSNLAGCFCPLLPNPCYGIVLKTF